MTSHTTTLSSEPSFAVVSALPITLPSTSSIDALRRRVTGPVLVPGDEGYAAETATWNLALQHHPVVAVGATGPDDVIAAVRFAGEHHLPVAVVATGHGAVVSADGAVLISTRRMTGVDVDPEARTVRIEAGARWQQVVDQAAPFGLAPLAGSAPDVGAVAYTLGGGLSPTLGRRYGYAADHVRSLRVVTPDGRHRDVDPSVEPDLFWALRGGKGNFGVVTELVCDLFPVRSLYGGGLFYSGEHAPAVLDAYRRLVAQAPDELASSFAFLRMPDVPFVPELLRGRFVLHVRIAHSGDPDAARRLLFDLRSEAPALLDTVGPMPFADFATIHADPVDPLPAIERGALLDELSPAAVATLLRVAGPDVDSPLTAVEVRHLGGALSRPPAVANAVGHRGARFSLLTVAVAAPGGLGALADAEQHLLDAMRPWSAPGALLNFLGVQDTAPERVRAAFDPAAADRLLRLKAQYDPTSMFRINHTLAPQATG